MYARVLERKIPIKFAFNHGVSFAFYFDDPDGPLDYRQPYAEPLDLTKSDEQLLEQVNMMTTTVAYGNTELEVK